LTLEWVRIVALAMARAWVDGDYETVEVLLTELLRRLSPN
jgi:hypothetical protein